jgi:nucleoside-diphosphate-sugar epimerase
LVTGANGQIGQELVEALVRRLGDRQVVRLDLDPPPETSGPFEVADVRDQESIEGIVAARDVEVIYHLASILSATGEEHPDRTWDVNVNGLKTILDVARKHDARVFWPSSIAVFGPATREDEAPQSAAMDPTTMYGVTKRSGELLCQYYHRRYGVDVRSLRYPGLVSYKIAPGGGTTDYAVEMFVQAARGSGYTCFLEAGTRLPMMYMPDAVRAALELMDASRGALSVHDSYNVSGVSFSPETLEAAIREHFPSFSCSFDSDHRQRIADDWPSSLDDRTAREDWGWAPEYGLDTMTEEMCNQLWEESGEREKA